jgi:predicted ester cyclase
VRKPSAKRPATPIGGLTQEAAMTTSKQILDRNITAVNARDLEGYLSNQQPDVEFVLPGGITLRGRDEVGQYTKAMWTAFPDATLAFGEQILAEDAAATAVVFSGTHTGPMSTPGGPLPPTGKHVNVHSVSMLRFEDGRVASEHVYFDQLELLSQLGLGPAPPSGD